MKLNTIELKGFKSFADRTVINFNKEITGIVGPNGCGKSNIVDAIRWVLGEQKTSSLRSEKMENLIFNGTRSRKASGIAEVTMTFDNTRNVLPTDFANVSITRIYHRNGESEYRLNNVPCRLKDILNLFMDTGVSSDTYAIIELGMIDDILNDKDHSRRKLFEQAAGIEKYKKRKKETLSKMESTEQDLERVRDLLAEIETNLKTLESQARKAQRHMKLRDDYKHTSLELSRLRVRETRTKFQELQSGLNAENDRLTGISAVISQLESAIGKEKGSQVGKEKALSAAQSELNKHLALVQSTENRRNLLHEQQRSNLEKMETLRRNIATEKERIAGLELEIETLTGSEAEAREQTESDEGRYNEKLARLEEAKASFQRQKEQSEAARSGWQQSEKQLHELEKALVVNRTRLDSLNLDKDASHKGSEENEAAFNDLSLELQALQSRKSAADADLNELLRKKEEWQAELDATGLLVDSLNEERGGVVRKMDATRHEFNLTKDLVENLEGFPESIKFLRKEVEQTREAPLLSDIITCPEAYRVSIENYLEPYLNYYVLNNFEEAFGCVQILSKASRGRANFFILDAFADYQSHAAMPGKNAVAALEIIEVDKKYHKLAAFLLDKVFLVDDGMRLEKDQNGSVYLSKSGQWIQSKCSVSGGSVGLFEGKRLGRARNLKLLEKEVRELEARKEGIELRLAEARAQLTKLRESGIPVKLSEMQAAADAIDRQFIGVEARAGHIKQLVDRFSDKRKEAEDQIVALETASASQEAVIETLRIHVAQSEAAFRQTGAGLEELEQALAAANQEHNEAHGSWHESRSRAYALAQELKFKNQARETARATVAALEADLSNCEHQSGANEEQRKEIEKEIEAAYTRKELLEKAVHIAEEAWHESRGTLQELEDKLRVQHRNSEEIKSLIGNIRDKETELKLELTRIRERLSVEFQADLEALEAGESEEGADPEALAQKVQAIRNRLDNFGEINPMALEAFEEMKKRYDFIIAQRTDLMQARENLLQTMKEIDDTATVQFMATFEAVQANFTKVFRSLFTEDDRCELFLTDPERPLESSIQIKAQPKGKRPLTIDQLSGGEKSLTAIALLFSLYLIRPAPFCIFDEVDAPLDDINVGKFTKIIKQFSADSQFIVVTHNKQTMTAVDMIYGVTMMEEGISKVVPVDFSQMN